MTIDDLGDVKQWAAQQWQYAPLVDERRTARAVRLGAALAAQPAASLSTQTGSWRDLKAAYRLLEPKKMSLMRHASAYFQIGSNLGAKLHQPNNRA
jgi:hypothetical protein